MKSGLYVGSFDPITLGHLDIIRQALLVFDHLIIGIGQNTRKTPQWNLDERKIMIIESIAEQNLPLERITVIPYEGSMMECARKNNANSIVRGLRQISDFGDEFTINGIAARALPSIPMTYFICRQDFLHVSSSSVKELASLDEDFSWMVTQFVQKQVTLCVSRQESY